MKNFLLTIVGLILSINAFAQNWQTFNSKIQYNFDDHFVVFDSVKVIEQDTVLYNFKTIRQVRDQQSSNYIYSAVAPTWTGVAIIVKPNGVNVFLNGDNDSIYVQTRAKLGSTFTFYNNPAKKLNITARVDSIVLGKILRVSDSLKYISLTNYNTGLVLSKNFGLLQTVPFLGVGYTFYNQYEDNYTANLSLIGNSSIAGTNLNLTAKDIYDFNPGDELDIKTWQNGGPNVTPHTVQRIEKYLTRILSANKDTLIYTLQVKQVDQITKTQEVVATINEIQTVKYVINDPADPLNRIPGKVYFDYPNGGILTYSVQSGNIKVPGGGHFPITCIHPDSCTQLVDGVSGINRYFKGLGGGYYLNPISLQTLGYYNRDLIYYKKGNTESGTPFDLDALLSVNDVQLSDQKTRVYPNPAKDKIAIEVNQASAVSIKNIIGVEVYKSQLNNGTNEINISQLASGIYFVVITTGDTTVTEKIVVE